MTFYYCRHCGNLVVKTHDSGVPILCCGEPMQPAKPGTADASPEKHVPQLRVHNGAALVSVGLAPHPMVPGHFIEWIVLETTLGWTLHSLAPGQDPQVLFPLAPGEQPTAAWALCNLHGLWRTDT